MRLFSTQDSLQYCITTEAAISRHVSLCLQRHAHRERSRLDHVDPRRAVAVKIDYARQLRRVVHKGRPPLAAHQAQTPTVPYDEVGALHVHAAGKPVSKTKERRGALSKKRNGSVGARKSIIADVHAVMGVARLAQPRERRLIGALARGTQGLTGDYLKNRLPTVPGDCIDLDCDCTDMDCAYSNLDCGHNLPHETRRSDASCPYSCGA